MAYDPLNRSTRVARTSFLIVGASSVITSAFSIELGEVGSLRIPFPEQTMSIVLIIATCYLFIGFLVAFKDDILYQAAPEALKPIIEELQTVRKEWTNILEFFDNDTLQHASLKSFRNENQKRLSQINYLKKITEIRKNVREGESAEYDDFREEISKAILLEIGIIDERLERQGRHWFSYWRLKLFDLGVPIIVFIIAVAGWFGGLDWIAPLLDAGADAAPQ